MDIQFLAEADSVSLQLEKAKRALESAKADLDLAKKNYEEMLARSETVGIPKAKLKKLTEDRIQALFEIGLLDFKNTPAAMKEPKAKKAKAKEAAASLNEDELQETPAIEAGVVLGPESE